MENQNTKLEDATRKTKIGVFFCQITKSVDGLFIEKLEHVLNFVLSCTHLNQIHTYGFRTLWGGQGRNVEHKICIFNSTSFSVWCIFSTTTSISVASFARFQVVVRQRKFSTFGCYTNFFAVLEQNMCKYANYCEWFQIQNQSLKNFHRLFHDSFMFFLGFLLCFSRFQVVVRQRELSTFGCYTNFFAVLKQKLYKFANYYFANQFANQSFSSIF